MSISTPSTEINSKRLSMFNFYRPKVNHKKEKKIKRKVVPMEIVSASQ